MNSPHHLRLSLAAAMELGFVQGLFYRGARLHCINLLLTYDDGCKANCAFCGLSRQGRPAYTDRKFIRVGWPTKPTEEIIARLKERQDRGVIERICLSMITHPRAKADTLALTERLAGEVELPISLLIAPTLLDRDDLAALREAGAERIGVAIDCATPELFDRLRGKGVKGPHDWDRYWRVYEAALDVFGAGMVGVHLICGLGESEQEFVSVMQRARDLGGSTHLFSFFPEGTSALAEHTPPPMGVYRRIQAARWLIDHDLSRLERFGFDEGGRIIDFGVDDEVIDRVLAEGDCFRTSGCPGATLTAACNRPFANERPGPDIRNFPFPLAAEDVQRCRDQLFEDLEETRTAQGGLR